MTSVRDNKPKKSEHEGREDKTGGHGQITLCDLLYRLRDLRVRLSRGWPLDSLYIDSLYIVHGE